MDFLQTLIELRNGAAVIDAGAKLKTLVDAVAETGKKGELTFKLTITPSKISRTQTTEVEIEHKVNVKIPERSTGRSIFYLTDQNDLVRNDPRQFAIDLQDTPAKEEKSGHHK